MHNRQACLLVPNLSWKYGTLCHPTRVQIQSYHEPWNWGTPALLSTSWPVNAVNTTRRCVEQMSVMYLSSVP